MADAQLTPERREQYWRRTSRLMWTIMVLWFVFSFVIHFFARDLNQITIIGFPLGFYFAAQGSLVAFVVLCFWNARAQNRTDREFGVAED
jgi:putative solute:sodium symporter small subunit